ncbi:MAG: sigma-70 family RNA polymerase sigma factor [Candidatus Tectomicrobia bacterium]|uniref:Sigma-70 family RNA polymerase sigma factor n=1 Tax=Tectimicrobiota bacterium TaxID=2528274 RepID=A0A932HYV6_UNCTE|nr:sigma-70 family RNA polymerase sigma factor [Candidatus Tectomicrobia bacterium]
MAVFKSLTHALAWYYAERLRAGAPSALRFDPDALLHRSRPGPRDEHLVKMCDVAQLVEQETDYTQKVLFMFYGFDLEARQIAEELKKTEAGIEGTIQRARRSLRYEMEIRGLIPNGERWGRHRA